MTLNVANLSVLVQNDTTIEQPEQTVFVSLRSCCFFICVNCKKFNSFEPSCIEFVSVKIVQKVYKNDMNLSFFFHLIIYIPRVTQQEQKPRPIK